MRIQRLRMASLVTLCLIVVASAICTYSYAYRSFDFLLYQQKTRSWNINMGKTYLQQPKTINIVAESDAKKDEYITYNIEIIGLNMSRDLKRPGTKGITNNDLTLSWNDNTGKSFIIGKGGSQSFTGTGTIYWHSSKIFFKHGQKVSITITLTFLPPAPMGKYTAEMWIDTI